MKFFVKSPAPEDHPAAPVAAHDSRLHTNLQDLIALRKHAHGFALNPMRPIKNQFVGRHSSSHRGRGLNFEEIAHYQHGDDIRTMDWKVTNRTGKPHVRVFTEERERPIMLVCDQRKKMMFGSQHKLKSVVASEIMSLLAWRQISLGDAVATLIFNDDLLSESRPHRSQQMLLKDFKTLARFNRGLVNKKPGDAAHVGLRITLGSVLDRLTRLCPKNFQIVLVSDLNDFDARAFQLTKSLALHNDVFVAQITDPVERSLPINKRFVASDGEGQIAINTANKNFKYKFEAYQQKRSEQLRADFRNAGVVLMEFDTCKKSYRQLRSLISENSALSTKQLRLITENAKT